MDIITFEACKSQSQAGNFICKKESSASVLISTFRGQNFEFLNVLICSQIRQIHSCSIFSATRRKFGKSRNQNIRTRNHKSEGGFNQGRGNERLVGF